MPSNGRPVACSTTSTMPPIECPSPIGRTPASAGTPGASSPRRRPGEDRADDVRVRGGDDVDVELVQVGDTRRRPDARVIDGDDEAALLDEVGGQAVPGQAVHLEVERIRRVPTAGEAVDQVVRRRRIEAVGRHHPAPHEVRAGKRQHGADLELECDGTPRRQTLGCCGHVAGRRGHAANGTLDRPRTFEEWNRSTPDRSTS